MLFEVYGENAVYQWLGWAIVFIGLTLANEAARRLRSGGIVAFLVLPVAMTVYCLAVKIGAATGEEWALNNPTRVF